MEKTTYELINEIRRLNDRITALQMEIHELQESRQNHLEQLRLLRAKEREVWR